MILTAYLFRSIIKVCLIITAVCSTLIYIGHFLENADTLSNQFTLKHLLLYSLAMLPGQVIDLFPIILSIGALVGLALMSDNNEITVLRSSGISLWQLFNRAMVPIWFLVLVVLAVSELNLAQYEQDVRAWRTGLLDRQQKNSLWVESNGSYTHIGSLFSDGESHNITQWQPDEQHRRLVLITDIKAMSFDQEGSGWNQVGVQETHFNPESITRVQTGQRFQESTLSPKLLNSRVQDVYKMPLLHLLKLAQEPAINSQDTHFELALWYRLLLPLSVFSLVLLSSSFAFGTSRFRDLGSSIFFGSAAGIISFMIQNVMISISVVYQVVPLIAILLPILFMSLAGGYSIYKRH